TAQQASFEGQVLILADIAHGTQHKNGSIEFCGSSPAQRIVTNLAAAALQGLLCSNRRFPFARLAGLLIALLQTIHLVDLPEQIAMILAQAGGADAAQMLNIARTPEVEHRVIANNE